MLNSLIPLVVAHRGYALRYPENTIESFQAAIASGAQNIELDIQFSHDGVPMVIHDPTLKRTAGRPETTWDLNASELERIEVGYKSRFGNKFDGVYLPRLSRIVDMAESDLQVRWFVEIKRQSVQRFGVDHVVESVGRALKNTNCVVISFLPEVVEAAKQTQLSVGWVVTDWTTDQQRTAQHLKPDYLFCNHLKLPPGAGLWAGTWAWVFYEITSGRIALSLAARGAQYVETMAVAEMIKALVGDRD